MITLKERYQNIILKCDESDCGHEEEFYGRFEEAMAMAKNNGWQLEEKKQTCPTCVDFNRQNIDRYQK